MGLCPLNQTSFLVFLASKRQKGTWPDGNPKTPLIKKLMQILRIIRDTKYHWLEIFSEKAKFTLKITAFFFIVDNQEL